MNEFDSHHPEVSTGLSGDKFREKKKGIDLEHIDRWTRLGHERLELISMPEPVKKVVRDSLETPQLGPYHNEGVKMAAHLGLIMETVDAIHAGTFDFHTLGLPSELADQVQDRITKAIRTNHEQMTAYVYLHDLAKPVCMNIEDAHRTQRVFSMEEWQELLNLHDDDPEKATAALTSQGYTKIGYRIGGELAKSLGVEEKDHGDEAVRMLGEMAQTDEEVKTYTQELELILKGIANHEMHFQVFNNTKTASKFEKFLAGIFTDDEIDFIYAACLIDIAGSLDKNGQSDFQGFRNMVIARENYQLVQHSGLRNVEPLMNLDSPEKILTKIEQLKREEVAKNIRLDEADIAHLVGQLISWGITREEDQELMRVALNQSVGKENPTSIIAQSLPNHLKRYIKHIKDFIETKVVI